MKLLHSYISRSDPLTSQQHDGEKDTRGPPDFSANSSSKLEDGDDDEGDEDEDLPARRKRMQDGKLKPPPDIVTSVSLGSVLCVLFATNHSSQIDYPTHRNLSLLQPPLSLHGISGQSGAGGPTLRISNDRTLGMPRDSNKRAQRPSLHPGHSRSVSKDLNSSGYQYQNPASFNQPNQYSPHQSRSHHQQSPNPQYQPFFPVPPHTSPPPSLIPLQADFHRSSRSSTNSGQGFGMPTRSSSSNSSTYENSSIYTGMARNQPSSSSQQMGPSGGSSGGDLFTPFLDASEQTRHHNQGPGFVAMDWPVHGGSTSASTGPSGASNSGEFSTHSLLP